MQTNFRFQHAPCASLVFWASFTCRTGNINNTSNSVWCHFHVDTIAGRKEGRIHLILLAKKFTSMVTILAGRYSVQPLATGWIVRKPNRDGGEISCTRPGRPWGAPSPLHTQRVGVITGTNWPRCDFKHPPPSRAVKERVVIPLPTHFVS